jgi:hypothetical protein
MPTFRADWFAVRCRIGGLVVGVIIVLFKRAGEGRLPTLVAAEFLNLLANVGKGLQDELGDIAKRQGIAARDALARPQREELAEDVVDVVPGCCSASMWAAQ